MRSSWRKKVEAPASKFNNLRNKVMRLGMRYSLTNHESYWMAFNHRHTCIRLKYSRHVQVSFMYLFALIKGSIIIWFRSLSYQCRLTESHGVQVSQISYLARAKTKHWMPLFGKTKTRNMCEWSACLPRQGVSPRSGTSWSCPWTLFG